jgi:hypothetical protein
LTSSTAHCVPRPSLLPGPPLTRPGGTTGSPSTQSSSTVQLVPDTSSRPQASTLRTSSLGVNKTLNPPPPPPRRAKMSLRCFPVRPCPLPGSTMGRLSSGNFKRNVFEPDLSCYSSFHFPSPLPPLSLISSSHALRCFYAFLFLFVVFVLRDPDGLVNVPVILNLMCDDGAIPPPHTHILI